jgi:CxxC-x17-CxxC domain-containing protein
MGYQGGGGFGGPKEMFTATCAECQKECQVPFKPSGDRPVYCFDCNKAFRQTRGDDRGRGPRAPRQMYSVNVACAECGTQITELPFQPSGDKPVYCKNCMMARRNS